MRKFLTVSALALGAASAPAIALGATPGSLDGAYSPATWTTKEGPGAAKPAPVLTPDAAAAAAADFAKKQAITNTLTAAMAPATTTAYTDYTAKLATLETSTATAAAAAKAVTTTLAAKTAADALVVKIGAQKSAADAAVATATTAVAAAQTALTTAQTSGTAAQITAAQAQLAKAQVDLSLAQAAQTPIANAYTTAVANQANAGGAYTTALNGKAAADSQLVLDQAAATNASTTLTTALASDTTFAAQLAAVNASAGTTFTATYAGLTAIYKYDDPVAPATYASNGVDRANKLLTSAAASKNTNIALASGALTGSAAALDVGAHFETEVLGALVDHETRITSVETGLTTEIAQRKAADAALEKKISDETTARLAMGQDLRDRIASSTATAIALGGVGILPDMNFSLAGNVGIYEGAQALAVSAAYRVAPNTFLTGAIGGGLNKHGSVGGRVGFIFGW